MVTVSVDCVGGAVWEELWTLSLSDSLLWYPPCLRSAWHSVLSLWWQLDPVSNLIYWHMSRISPNWLGSVSNWESQFRESHHFEILNLIRHQIRGIESTMIHIYVVRSSLKQRVWRACALSTLHAHPQRIFLFRHTCRSLWHVYFEIFMQRRPNICVQIASLFCGPLA